MEEYLPVLAIDTFSDDITPALIEETVWREFYSGSSGAVVLPSVTVGEFPEGGRERILEIAFDYSLSRGLLKQLAEKTDEKAEQVVSALEGEGEAERLFELYSWLSSNADYTAAASEVDVYDRGDIIYTAYGPLVNGSGAGEGFALAYMRLCKAAGLECEIVIGRYEGVTHVWNMVKVGEDWYHVDSASVPRGEGIAFLLSDENMPREYWWDTEMYRQCSGTMTVHDIIGAAPDAPAEETPADEGTPLIS